MRLTKIFYASDVHGSEITFRKFIGAAKLYNPNVLILGGDLTGKMITTVVQCGDGTYTAEFLDVRHVIKDENELRAFEKIVRDSGYYVYRTTPEGVKALAESKDLQDKLFSELMVQTLESWVRLAEENLRGTGIKCFVLPGNDDSYVIDEVLAKSDAVQNPEADVVRIDESHEMISLAHANITPWNCPRDTQEAEIYQKIKAQAEKVQNMENCVFNFHCPPFNSQIDLAPKLDKEFRPVMSGGEAQWAPAGSMSVRKAIEEYQPLLGVHGHIHESRGVVNIGRTTCINPGSEYGEGILRGAIINLDRDGSRVRSYQFVSG